MEEPGGVKVLLCSPLTNVGGISRWTRHILNYYHLLTTDIELKQYYPEGKGAYQNTPLLLRICIGIRAYVPFLFGLNKELKTYKYDIVHFVSSASFSLLRDFISLKIAKARKVKTVIHFRFGRIPDLYEAKNWEQKLIDRVVRSADSVIVIDHKSYVTLTGLGYENIELLPNPLTPEVSRIIALNKNIKREKRKLLFAGHVVETKGVFELIEACKKLSDIKLIILGYVTEKMRQILIERAGDNSSKWLEIVGEKDFETTIKEMLSADVFVLPTYTEGFPNVILESMACACPIVSTNVGAIPEMLDIEGAESLGICVEPQNVLQLTLAIRKMLNNREYALRCGLNARKRVNELYSMPIIWNRMSKIWESLIK